MKAKNGQLLCIRTAQFLKRPHCLKNLEGMWPARLSFDLRFTTPRPIILRWGRREGGSIDNKAQWKCGSLRQAADIISEKLEIAVNIVINNSSVGVLRTMVFIIHFGAIG